MNDAVKFTIQRVADYERLIEQLKSKADNRTLTARRIIRIEQMREEASLRYLIKHG